MKEYKKCKTCRYHKLAKETTGSNCGYRYPEFYNPDKDGCSLYEKENGQDDKIIEAYKNATEEEQPPKEINKDGKVYRLTATTRSGVPVNDAYYNIEYLINLGFTDFITRSYKKGYYWNYAFKEA